MRYSMTLPRLRLTTAALAFAALAAAGATALASTTALGPPPPAGTALPKGQCLVTRDLGRHAVLDKNTLLIRSYGRASGVYRITMSNGCLKSAISSDPIRLQEDGSFCGPADISLFARGGQCAVQSVVKLNDAEIATLPRGARP